MPKAYDKQCRYFKRERRFQTSEDLAKPALADSFDQFVSSVNANVLRLVSLGRANDQKR